MTNLLNKDLGEDAGCLPRGRILKAAPLATGRPGFLRLGVLRIHLHVTMDQRRSCCVRTVRPPALTGGPVVESASMLVVAAVLVAVLGLGSWTCTCQRGICRRSEMWA